MDVEKWVGATECGDVTTIESLLAAGVNVNTRAVSGETGLMRAAAHGHAAAVELLLDWGAPVNVWRRDGFTALSLAAFFGHAEVVAILLRAGANIYVLDDVGFTAERWAAAHDHPEIVELLQHAAADGAPAPLHARAAAAAAGPPGQAPVLQRSEELIATPVRIRASAPIEVVATTTTGNGAGTRIESAHTLVPPAPATGAAATLSQDTETFRRDGHINDRGAWSRTLGGVLLGVVLCGFATYLIMRASNLELRRSQPNATGAEQNARTPEPAIQTNLTPLSAPIPQSAPSVWPVQPAEHKSTESAPRVEVMRAPAADAPGAMDNARVMNNAAAAKPKRVKLDAVGAQPNVAMGEKVAARARDADPVLISEAHAPTTQDVTADAKSARSKKDEGTRREPAARFTVPLAPVASDPPIKPPAKKVIPWP